MSRDKAPPDKKGGPDTTPGPTTNYSPQHTTGKATGDAAFHGNGIGRHCVTDTAAALHRRRQASRRLVPLECGCCADPWDCSCDTPPLTERMVTAGAQAARHLLECGHVPILKLDTLRALHARGGDDRRLAQELYELAGGEA
jgi:hypothetical protein